MVTLRIFDLDSGALAFDLRDLIELLAPHSIRASWTVSPFDIYTDCLHCAARIKLRSFSADAEIEDVFDPAIPGPT